jgi:hypothetical protein
MLEKRIPAELNKIKIALVDIDKRKAYEPWRLALTVDLVDAIEGNCAQLLKRSTRTGSRLPLGSRAIWSSGLGQILRGLTRERLALP